MLDQEWQHGIISIISMWEVAQWRNSKPLDLWSMDRGFNSHQDKAA